MHTSAVSRDRRGSDVQCSVFADSPVASKAAAACACEENARGTQRSFRWLPWVRAWTTALCGFSSPPHFEFGAAAQGSSSQPYRFTVSPGTLVPPPTPTPTPTLGTGPRVLLQTFTGRSLSCLLWRPPRSPVLCHRGEHWVPGPFVPSAPIQTGNVGLLDGFPERL